MKKTKTIADLPYRLVIDLINDFYCLDLSKMRFPKPPTDRIFEHLTIVRTPVPKKKPKTTKMKAPQQVPVQQLIPFRQQAMAQVPQMQVPIQRQPINAQMLNNPYQRAMHGPFTPTKIDFSRPGLFYGYFSKDITRKVFLVFANVNVLIGTETRISRLHCGTIPTGIVETLPKRIKHLRYCTRNVLNTTGFHGKSFIEKSGDLESINNISVSGDLKLPKTLRSLTCYVREFDDKMADSFNAAENLSFLEINVSAMNTRKVLKLERLQTLNVTKMDTLTDVFVEAVNSAEKLRRFNLKANYLQLSKPMNLKNLVGNVTIEFSQFRGTESEKHFVTSVNSMKQVSALVLTTYSNIEDEIPLDLPKLKSLKFGSHHVRAFGKFSFPLFMLDNLKKFKCHQMQLTKTQILNLSALEKLERVEIAKSRPPPNMLSIFTNPNVRYITFDFSEVIQNHWDQFKLLDGSKSSIEHIVFQNGESMSIAKSFYEQIFTCTKLVEISCPFHNVNENLQAGIEKNVNTLPLKRVRTKRHYRMNNDVIQKIKEMTKQNVRFIIGAPY